MILTQINVGGPCKLSDNGTIIYFEDGLKITPTPTYRDVPSDVAGDHDQTLVDLVYKITGRPKAVWTSGYRAALLPTAYTNWTTAGGLCCGSANRSLIVLGADANGFTFTRGCLTKMPDLFLGLGNPLYSEIEYTAYIGTGKVVTDTDAFYTLNTTAWDQTDYPTANQEQLCTLAWGAVTGWDTVYAQEGFKLTHEFKTTPIKQGNITVDQRIQSYRAMLSFTPQQPTTAQLLTAFGLQSASNGIGSRRSGNVADAVITGTGISVTAKSAGMNKGEFIFDSKANRHGEFGMITALTAPGTRLAFA